MAPILKLVAVTSWLIGSVITWLQFSRSNQIAPKGQLKASGNAFNKYNLQQRLVLKLMTYQVALDVLWKRTEGGNETRDTNASVA